MTNTDSYYMWNIDLIIMGQLTNKMKYHTARQAESLVELHIFLWIIPHACRQKCYMV